MSSRREPVAAARAALAAGQPWVARDRLAGVLGNHPGDPDVSGLLGDAWWALGDPARAGRYWLLSDREGPEVDEALAAWRAASPSAHDRARALRVRPDAERQYPPVAVARLAELSADVRRDGVGWTPGERVHGARWSLAESRLLRAVVVAAVLAATVGVWLVGFFSLVSSLRPG